MKDKLANVKKKINSLQKELQEMQNKVDAWQNLDTSKEQVISKVKETTNLNALEGKLEESLELDRIKKKIDNIQGQINELKDISSKADNIPDIAKQLEKTIPKPKEGQKVINTVQQPLSELNNLPTSLSDAVKRKLSPSGSSGGLKNKLFNRLLDVVQGDKDLSLTYKSTSKKISSTTRQGEQFAKFWSELLSKSQLEGDIAGISKQITSYLFSPFAYWWTAHSNLKITFTLLPYGFGELLQAGNYVEITLPNILSQNLSNKIIRQPFSLQAIAIEGHQYFKPREASNFPINTGFNESLLFGGHPFLSNIFHRMVQKGDLSPDYLKNIILEKQYTLSLSNDNASLPTKDEAVFNHSTSKRQIVIVDLYTGNVTEFDF